jgi:hypothetical protein
MRAFPNRGRPGKASGDAGRGISIRSKSVARKRSTLSQFLISHFLGTYLVDLDAFALSVRDLRGGSGADLMALGLSAAGPAKTAHGS